MYENLCLVPDRPSAPPEREPYDFDAHDDRVREAAERAFRADSPELMEFLLDVPMERFVEMVDLLLGDAIEQQRGRAIASQLRDEFVQYAINSPWCSRAAGLPFSPRLSEAK